MNEWIVNHQAHAKFGIPNPEHLLSFYPIVFFFSFPVSYWLANTMSAEISNLHYGGGYAGSYAWS